MGTIKTLNKWANKNTYYPLDIVRVALGVFLFSKGLNFMANMEMLTELIKPLQTIGWEMALVHYVAPAHLIGGILIAFGLLTRWATIVQLPILIGAVLINFIGSFDSNAFILACIALVLAVFFTFYGSGKHSVDYYLKMQQ